MREKIKLESTAGTGHFYTTTKNKKTMPEKMEIKVRSQGPQARRLQGSEAEVIRPASPRNPPESCSGGFCCPARVGDVRS